MSNSSENSVNPYAVQSLQPPLLAEQTGQIFQKGKLLIVHNMATFPDRCVKSNEPTTERLKRKLSWHHPLIFLLLLVNLLIYVLVAMIVRKTAVLQIPLAARYKAARIRWMLIAWSMALLSLALFVVGLATTDQVADALSAFLLLQFPLAIIAALFIGLFGCRVIYARKIDDQYVWIGGTGEEFRRSFPEWPYPG
jgi:hypothetical protein